MFIDNETVSYELYKSSKNFKLNELFCDIDWSVKHAPQVKTAHAAYVPESFVLSAFIDRPDWMQRGLSETAPGYGNKLTTQYKVICENGKTYRVYCRCYSNVGTLYILIGGYEKIIYEYIIISKLERSQCL